MAKGGIENYQITTEITYEKMNRLRMRMYLLQHQLITERLRGVNVTEELVLECIKDEMAAFRELSNSSELHPAVVHECRNMTQVMFRALSNAKAEDFEIGRRYTPDELSAMQDVAEA